MKKLLLLITITLNFLVTNAQIKVYSTGSTAFGNTSTTPTYPMQFFVGTVGMTFTSRPLLWNIASSDPRIQTSSGGNIVFYNTANNGHLTIQVLSVSTMSDAKFKANVTPIDRSARALSLIKQLNGVEYNLIKDVTKRKYSGFVAQEVEKVLPHIVTTDDSVGNKLIDYQAIIPYLVEAVKEQQKTIEALQTQLKSTTAFLNKSNVSLPRTDFTQRNILKNDTINKVSAIPNTKLVNTSTESNDDFKIDTP